MDDQIFWFGVTSRRQKVPFKFRDNSGTLPVPKQSAPRVDSVVDIESEDDSTSFDDANDDEDSKPVEMPKRKCCS